MKIIQISFKNINNLKGENTISFADEPLASAGIFAITGPTGAGKSSILDVITLALFNRIPRFSGTITKSAVEGLGSVVTHHTDEASASITYEIQKRKYTSSWTINKTKKGKLKDYEMFIYDENGRPLDLKKSEVPSRNEEIIGLKYDQFIKSIILSQGQFSRFLKAGKNERGQLLENLTGSSIYRKLGVAAYEKHKTIKAEVAQEKDRLDNIICLSNEERHAINEKINHSVKEKQELDQQLMHAIEIKQIKTALKKNSFELAAKRSEYQVLIKEEEAFLDDQKKLEIYNKLSVLQAELTRYTDSKSQLTKLEIEKETNAKLLAQAKNTMLEVIDAMQILTKQEVSIDNFKEVMSSFEKEINSIVQKIEYVKGNGEQTRLRINNKISKSSLSLNPKISPEQALEELTASKNRAIKVIIQNGLSLDTNVDQLKKTIIENQTNVQRMKELFHLYEHISEKGQKIVESQKQVESYGKEIERLIPLKDSIEKLVQTSSENIALLEKQKQDGLLIAKLSDHRQDLVDGAPCPLCGALHHPYAEHNPTLENDIDQQVLKAKTALQKHQNELQIATTGIASNETASKLSVEKLQNLSNELKEVEKEVKLLKEQYEGEENVEWEYIQKSIENAESRVKTLSSSEEALNYLQLVDELLTEFATLKGILNEHKLLTTELKSKYVGIDVSTDCNRLQDGYVRANTQLTRLSSILEVNQASMDRNRKTLAQSSENLMPKLKSIGFDTIEKATSYLLSETEAENIKLRKELLKERRTSIVTQINTLEAFLKETKPKDKQPDKDLELLVSEVAQNEKLRDHYLKVSVEQATILSNDDKERKRSQSKAQEIEKLNRKMSKWDLLNKMIGDAGGNKFANFAQGLTLQNLLVFANRRLQNLSDRYLIDKPINDGPLTVIDQYQGNIQRAVTTLSGGESFLISLALALSLSDMASKNVRLESLFIDEGFGTLDQETLDVAMNTLEKLQTESQKTVGVISHVEALKDRINVQIKLEKNSQGYSAIQVVG